MSEEFKIGFENYRAGEFAKAEEVLRKAVEANPENYRAKGLLGAAMAELGNRDEALTVVADAFSGSLQDPMIGVIYVQILAQAGDMAGARDVAEKSVTSAVNLGDWDIVLETAEGLCQAQMFAASARAYNIACDKTVLNVEHGLVAAAVNAAAGNLQIALFHLNAQAEAGVKDERVFKSAAEILKQRASWVQYYNATKALTEIDAQNRDYWDEHATACLQTSRYKESAEAYDRKNALGDADAAALATSARLWLLANDKARASALVAEAVTAPGADTAEAQLAIGMTYAMRGERDTALDYIQKAMALDPTNAEAFVQFSLQQEGALDEKIVEQVRAAAARDDVDVTDKAALLFVVGDAHRSNKDFAAAFAEYEKANGLMKTVTQQIGRSYDPAREHEVARRIFARGKENTSNRPGLAPIPFTPIFVVGMPRSGTTLLEGLLSGHSDVASGGESTAMTLNFNSYFVELETGRLDANLAAFHKAVDDWRQGYIDLMSVKLNKKEGYVVDKQPLNFKAIGLIRAIFPEAPIIYTQRDPIDACFSIYRRQFADTWTFANDLQDIAHFHGIYSRFMNFWEQTFPGALIKVQYEDLVGNLETEMRRVIAGCGLEWQDGCLDPGGADRVINTFSAVQAREAVSIDYSGDSDRFSAFLGPLRDGLIGAGIDLKTGALTA